MAITRTTLAAALNNSSRNVSLASTTGLAVGDRLVMGNEIALVNEIVAAGFIRVQRGFDGTAPKAHANGTSAEFGPAGDFGGGNATQVDQGANRGRGLQSRPVKVYTAAGEIQIQEGIHVIRSGGGALAMTIADPDPDDDGKVLTVLTDEAEAHTLDNSAGSGFNGGGALSDVGTFGAIGDTLTICAINGVWQVVGNEGVTLA